MVKAAPRVEGGADGREYWLKPEYSLSEVNTDILLQNIIKKGQNEPNEGKMLHNKRAKTDSICTT